MKKIFFNLFYLIILSSLFNYVSCQVMSPGRCPKLPPFRNFDISKYQGIWYEVERYRALPEAASSCGAVNYIYHRGDKRTFGVEITQNALGQRFKNYGTTTFLKKDRSADLRLDLLMDQSPIPFNVHVRYLILDTDYKNYTIKWFCQEVGSMNFQGFWILSRTKYIPENVRNHIYKTMHNLGLDPQLLVKSDQSYCTAKDYF